MLQGSGSICVLSAETLMGLAEAESAISELHQAAISRPDDLITYAADPDVVKSLAAQSRSQLPDPVQQVCNIVTNCDKSVQPVNQVLDMWREQGLTADVPWAEAASLLQLRCDNNTGNEVAHPAH